MNVTLEEAGRIRSFLNSVGLMVKAENGIMCNPNVFGATGVTMVPEPNIPRDGAAYNLHFVFEGAPGSFPVATVRQIIQTPGLDTLWVLYRSLWPAGARSDFDSRLLRVPQIQQLANKTIRELADPWKPLPRPEPVSEVSLPPPSRPPVKRATKRSARRATKKPSKRK